MLQELFNTFEELKKYVFIVNRGQKKPLIIRFRDEQFYHLIGLHKINIDMFFPSYVKTKARKYTYMKKNIEQFDGIINNQKKGKNTLNLRINTFSRILDLLNNKAKTSLYDLRLVPAGSLYKGDYGLLKIYEDVNCLLGLKVNFETEKTILCAPQSWMADKRVIQITEFKMPIYMDNISVLPIGLYDAVINGIYSK